MSQPSTMRAIKSLGPDKAEIQNVPLPKLRDTYIQVKVHSVALNPTDWKHVAFLSSPGATVGCDFSGTVTAVGSAVTKKWQPGDLVAGFTHGVNHEESEDGCFAEYAVAKGDLQCRIPKNVSFEDAATLGVGISTVGQGLYQSLKLPLPSSPAKTPIWVLIYGGSTATGSLAIQYAKLSGCKVVTTCSERNFGFVKSLGAEEAFDYKDKDVGEKIRHFTDDQLSHVFDCISEGDSPRICAEAVSQKNKGKISYLLPVKDTPRGDVETGHTLAYTITGESFSFRGTPVPAKPEDFEFGKEFWELSEKLLAEGKIKVHTPDVRKGGLEGVFDGLKDLREGKVSGKKIVYNLE